MAVYNIVPPDIRGTTPEDIRNYLYQFCEQLNFILGQIDKSQKNADDSVKAIERYITPSSDKSHETFNDLKGLISSSSDIMDAYYRSFFSAERNTTNVSIKKDTNIGTSDDPVDFTLNGESLCDYVIDCGETDDGWMYRKWNNGILEQWKSESFTAQQWLSWGSMYRSQDFTISFGESYISAAYVYTSCNASGGDESYCIPITHSCDDSGFDVFLARPSAGSTDANKYNIIIYAIGKWK